MELLKPISSYFAILRPTNLFIVAITQCIIYQFVILKLNVFLVLSGSILWLFILDTMIIAGSGYIINDIQDFKTDMINKPDKTFILHNISIHNAYVYYYILILTGLLISIYIAIKTNNLPLILLYPLACGLLYLYSTKYKNSILTGNVIVSLFVAFVTGIIIVAERNVLFYGTEDGSKNIIIELLTFYMIFSFLINMIREIIKDIEDIEGDKLNSIKTFPITYGVNKSKIICIILSALIIFTIGVWPEVSLMNMDLRLKAYLYLFIIAPLVVIIQILTKSTGKRDFSKISTILKWTMIAGLGFLVLISNSI